MSANTERKQSRRWNGSTGRRNGSGIGSGSVESLPCSEDAERGLLASLLLGGDAVAIELAVPLDAFYIPAHRILWEALNDLVAEKRPLDFIVVRNRLSALGQLEEIGGKEYLSSLYGFVPTHANYRHYAQIVLENYRIRRAILGTQEMTKKLYERGLSSWDELRRELETSFADMISNDDSSEVSAKQITLEWAEELTTRRDRLLREGIDFGLKKLDEQLGMQQPGELVTIGAPTSTGKTLLAYQGIAHNLGRGLPVGLISLEMTASQTWDRLASHMQRISMNAFRSGEFSAADGKALVEFQRQMSSLPFYYTSGRHDIDAIKQWTRRAKARHGVRLLVVDYLQRVAVPEALEGRSRQEQVAYVSKELKNLALDQKLVVWCPVQLNRNAEVRESQAIQMDADISFRILLDEHSYTSGEITIDKVRQGKVCHPWAIWIKGGLQTIEEQ